MYIPYGTELKAEERPPHFPFPPSHTVGPYWTCFQGFVMWQRLCWVTGDGKKKDCEDSCLLGRFIALGRRTGVYKKKITLIKEINDVLKWTCGKAAGKEAVLILPGSEFERSPAESGRMFRPSLFFFFFFIPLLAIGREFQDTSTLDLSLGLCSCYSKKRNGQVHATPSSVMTEVATVCQEHCQAVSSCSLEF